MYTVVFGNENKYEVTNEDGKWLLNNEMSDFDCLKVGKNEFHLIFNNHSIHTTLLTFDRNAKTFTFRIDEKIFTLKVEDHYDRLLTQMGMEVGSHLIETEFKAPMPGLVLDILVKPGDEVEKDQPLVILEAMKMENALKAPGNATIESVEIKKNDKIDKNQVLIRFA